MNSATMMARSLVLTLAWLLLATTLASGKSVKQHSDSTEDGTNKQLLFLGVGKETSPPNFMRLVVMRLIYGLASTMGLEERLEGAFNGVFVPPNADEGDLFGGGGDGEALNLFGGGGGGDDLLGGLFDDGF